MQADDKAHKLKRKPTIKTTATAAAQYDPETQTTKTTTAATGGGGGGGGGAAAISSTESTKHRTIGALVRGIHDTGTHDLHRPLLCSSEEQEEESRRHCSKSSSLAARRVATELAPHASLPRLVINIEASTEALTTTLDGSNTLQATRAALSPSPTPTRSLTPELNGDACSVSVNGDNHHQHNNDQSTTPNTTRRFSHFNLALRRFSHIHVHVLYSLFPPLSISLFAVYLSLSLSNLSLVVCACFCLAWLCFFF